MGDDVKKTISNSYEGTGRVVSTWGGFGFGTFVGTLVATYLAGVGDADPSLAIPDPSVAEGGGVIGGIIGGVMGYCSAVNGKEQFKDLKGGVSR